VPAVEQYKGKPCRKFIKTAGVAITAVGERLDFILVGSAWVDAVKIVAPDYPDVVSVVDALKVSTKSENI
jgi:hypothetical protein